MSSQEKAEFLLLYEEAHSDKLERQKVLLSVLLEEYKFRSQELIHLQNENNRWIAVYVSALTIVISWLLTNDKASNIGSFLNANGSNNAALVITLGIINSVYTLSLAFKGYQVQQIALFLCDELGSKLSAITGQSYISLDIWRRVSFTKPRRRGKPDFIRLFYYPIISLLPVAVSVGILLLHYHYVWSYEARYAPLNWYSYVAVLMTLLSLVLSGLTGVTINRRWTLMINKSSKVVKELV